MSHLGFNAGEAVYMTEEVVKDLEKAIKKIITLTLLLMVFLGSTISRTSMNEYANKMKCFLNFVKGLKE